MKYVNIDMYPLCPKCNSKKTGVIKPRTVWSGKKESKDLYRSISCGKYVKYVDGKKYEDYYKWFGINMYCEDCDYEFRGEISQKKINEKDAEDYMGARGCEERLQTAKIERIPILMQIVQNSIDKRKKKKE